MNEDKPTLEAFYDLMQELDEEHDPDHAEIRQSEGNHEIVLRWNELADFPRDR